MHEKVFILFSTQENRKKSTQLLGFDLTPF